MVLDQKLKLKLEDIIATLPGHVYWKDKNGALLGCNEEQAKKFGLSKAVDVIGKTDYDFYDKATADEVVRNDQEVMRSGQAHTYEESVTLPDGHKITYISKKAPLRNERGEIIGTLGSSINITVQKEKESGLLTAKELAEKERKTTQLFLENVISNLPDHVFWEDIHGRFLGCNDQQAKSFGLEKAEDLIGKTVWEMGELLGWDPSMADQLRQNDLMVMETGKTISAEETVMWADGRPHTFLAKKAPLKDENGTCIGMLGLAFDITDRKTMENSLIEAKKQAEEANRAKSDFVANISHDIRTPLHTVLGTAELLKLKKHLPEQEEYLEAIIQSGDALLKLVENILDFSKLEQGEMEFKKESFDFKQLIQNAIATVNKPAREKGIDIITDYSNDTPTHLMGHADAVQRILINLLGNAIKFTESGQIIISTELVKSSEKTVTINLIVKDTGIGIPKNELKHIFDRFYRVDPSYRGKYKGSGLGLAITKKLVENLHGEITVDSHPGVGTKFVCTLPFKRDRRDIIDTYEVNDQTPNYVKSNRKPSILLVEDVPLIQKFSMEILETLGCTVTLANTGSEALEFSESPYDLIFMDIGLPDQDGLSVIRKIRRTEQNKKTPIIALTAHATEQMKQECILAGVDDFLAKPASYKSVLKCLNKYAGK